MASITAQLATAVADAAAKVANAGTAMSEAMQAQQTVSALYSQLQGAQMSLSQCQMNNGGM